MAYAADMLLVAPMATAAMMMHSSSSPITELAQTIQLLNKTFPK